jgi:hypothetical protein
MCRVFRIRLHGVGLFLPPSCLLSPFPSVISNLNLFLDRNGTHQVTSVVILSRLPRRNLLSSHTLALTPFLSSPSALFSRTKIANSFLSNSFRTLFVKRGGTPPFYNSLPTVTQKMGARQPTCATVSSLDATHVDMPASVANKRLTARLSLSDATLTKNRGVPISSNVPTFKRSNGPQSHCAPQPLVPQSVQAPDFFAFRGNNSAPPGV